MKRRKLVLVTLISIFTICQTIFAQGLFDKKTFTIADTLQGMNGPARQWWDVTKYNLHVKFNLEDSTISGYNTVDFKIVKKGKDSIQVDLQPPLIIDSIVSYQQDKLVLRRQVITEFYHKGNAYFFNYQMAPKQQHGTFTVYYHGKPVQAKLPPWDNGMIWKRDSLNNPWITVTAQGIGASIWYPCKDYLGDEPDSAEMHITCPDSLVAIGNGRLRNSINNHDGTTTYTWAVINPINNYCFVPYIGKYVHFGETFPGEKGNLSMDYWVLTYNLDKAKKQFAEAPKMMTAFEYWFGPYPFYADGYKLVEAPYLGMEHQSAVAYGNHYANGYDRHDLSETGWGMKWDFIIVHESGHEWFGNNITNKDIADMWTHEAFTDYSETLFTDYYFGKSAGDAYCRGLRRLIQNDIPIIGVYNVNAGGSGDMYYKGANMIHMIRQVISNDSLFRKILRGLNSTFYHQTVTTKQIEMYISKTSKIDFSKVFTQYLRTSEVPVLEYKQEGRKLSYRFTNCIKGFTMPVKINCSGTQWIKPTEAWKVFSNNAGGEQPFSVDSNFYIFTKKVA